MKQNSNEIDLIELLLKTYIYFKKYIWVFAAAILIGIIFTFVMRMNKPEVYESSMVLKTNSEKEYMYAITFREFQNRFEKNPGELIVKILNSVNAGIVNGNQEKLAQKMNLKKENLESIISIMPDYKYTKGEAISKLVSINVTASNTEVFKTLGQGIIRYINNNSYISEKQTADSLFLIQVISNLNLKIDELNKLQEKFLKDGKINDLIIYKDNSFFAESIMLNSLKEKLILELKNLQQTVIVEDFYTPKQAKKESIKKQLTVNVFIFLFLSFIIVFIIILNKKANTFIKK